MERPATAPARLTTLGIPSVDAQHASLLTRARALAEAVRSGDGDRVALLLNGLLEETVLHFRSEELLMEASSYGGLAEHREAHQAFVADGMQLASELRRSGLTPGVVERLPALSEWLVHHAAGKDAAMARAIVMR